MLGTDFFQVIHGEGFYVGELAPTGTGDLEVGTAMARAAAAPTTHCEGGTGDHLGYLTKKFTTAGPSYEDMVFGIDLPGKYGQKATLCVLPPGSEIEVEGEPSKAYNATTEGLLVTTGTGAITTGTSVGTALSVQAGRWRVAQSGNIIRGIVRSQLTPVADASNIRILIEIVDGGVKV